MITYEKVRELFDYREDGNLIWKKKISRNNKANIGDIAGYKTKIGRITITINKKLYKAHRLIYLWHHGYMPENFIDHIDRNPDNNKIKNLRETTNQCNIRNTGNYKHNKSGVKGVCWHKQTNKWRAQIAVNQKQKAIGLFDDKDEAVLHRLAAEQCLGWEGCDSSSPAYQYALKHKLIKEI